MDTCRCYLSLPFCLSLSASFHHPSLRPSYLPLSLTLPSSLPTVESIRGFAHAAGFAAARQCLQLLVVSALCACVPFAWLAAPLRGIPSSRTPTSGGFIRSASLAGRFGSSSSSTPLGPGRGSASHKEGGIKVVHSDSTTLVIW